MKKFLRWSLYLLLVLIGLGIVAILSFDTIAKSIAQKRIRAETGMETQIGKLEIGLRTQSVHLQNFKLINPPEFGGSTFVDLPELEVQYDLEALGNHQLHLKLVRVNLAEINIVQNKEGKQNTDLFTKQGAGSSTNASPRARQMTFAGIDTLEISLGRAKFTSELYPNQNFDRDLGIRNKVYRDIKTEKDLQNVGGVLALQAGFNILMEGVLSNPKELQQKGSAAGKETEEILKDVVAPFKKKP